MSIKTIITVALVAVLQAASAQTVLTVTRKRPAVLDISKYEKIVLGDIVNASGNKTSRSRDLEDALTSKLFNSNAQEVIDRNAIEGILASQNNLTAINEATVAALSKKMSSAVMIIARIQNEKLYNEQKNAKMIISTAGCGYQYWWKLTGDITAQIKIIDIKTGKMLYTNPVTQNINLETKRECEPTKLGDTAPLLKDATVDLAASIAKLVVPYSEDISFTLSKPISLKSPFKNLTRAIQIIESGDYETGLGILQEYASDKSLKPNIQGMAIYNYAVGLTAAEKYDQAIEQLNKLKVMEGGVVATDLLAVIQKEKKFQSQLMAVAK